MHKLLYTCSFDCSVHSTLHVHVHVARSLLVTAVLLLVSVVTVHVTSSLEDRYLTIVIKFALIL